MGKYCSLLFCLLIVGCGSQALPGAGIDSSLTRCGPRMASILVGDGFFQIQCGCSGVGEEPGTTFSSSTGALNCHLPTRDSQVFFYFQGVLRHSILSTGGNRFNSSPLSDPSAAIFFRSHVAFFNVPAVYPFQEGLSGLTGTIVVPVSP